MRALFIALGFFFAVEASAEVQLKVYRKVAVFPIGTPSSDINGEDAWWQAREALVKDQRFLVAARRLMVNRGVFQPRKALKPSDSIILSKILDADLLITIYLEEREIFFKAYDGENGFRVWEGRILLHPAVPIQEQLGPATLKLMQDFILSIPYQGYVVPDDRGGPLLAEKGKDRVSQVFVGNSLNLAVGDPVQWVQVFADPSKPLHENPRLLVVAEGEIAAVLGDRVEAKVTRIRSADDIVIDGPVRFPKELSRLKELYVRPGERGSELAPELLSAEMQPAEKVDEKQSSTSTALAFLASIATMILLAF